MLKLFHHVHELQGYLFAITDNGNATADRYTVGFSDGDYLALGPAVSLWSEGYDPAMFAEHAEDGEEAYVCLGNMPEHYAAHILHRVNEGWQAFLEQVAARDPKAVAYTREQATPNEGTSDSAGVGIYAAGNGYCVRMDTDDASEDRGPFLCPREALKATLPDWHSLAGEEYHPPIEATQTTPIDEVTQALADLEARVLAAED